MKNKKRKTNFKNWWQGTKNYYVWWTLAWYDIVLRYRRSVIGPIWLTISMGAMIVGMGPLYSALFNTNLATFFPYISAGIIFWAMISSLVTDSCNVFISSSQYLKQSSFPLSLFVWRMLVRNIITNLHHVVILVPVMYFSNIEFTKTTLLIIPSIILTIINAHNLGIILGFACARFRDIAQIVASVMQISMFLTPVFWAKESLPERANYILYNPFAMVLDILRSPLLNQLPATESWVGVLVCTVLTTSLAIMVFIKYRTKLIYWL
jgi:lipopolysaccharide transport system permease protein